MPRQDPDVCVIGSGAAGGTLATRLAELGAEVLLIEGGGYRDPAHLATHRWPWDRAESQVPPVEPDLREEPYESRGDPIGLSRGRVLGGRTTHWNAVSLRFSEDDFRERSVNGIEEDWPISYRELAPYYDQAEERMVVCGTKENLEVLPDGRFIKPIAWRCSEHILAGSCSKLGLRMIPVRKALATGPGHGRGQCHHCGHCMEGCGVSAIFNTAEHMLPLGQATGRLTVRTGWMAHELLTDEEGRVRSVRIVQRKGRKEEEVRARIFAVCCGNVESARLLLNSKSPRFPNGLANNNDVVGRYLHGHLVAERFGYLSKLVDRKVTNQDGATDHAYVPRFKPRAKVGYRGGWGIQVNVRSYMKAQHAKHLKGFGLDFKREVRRLQPAMSNLTAFGKVIGIPENRITLHPTRRDVNGLPIPVVRFRWQRNDLAMFGHMREVLAEIYEDAGTEFTFELRDEPAGFAAHEVGVVRMGRDPKTSVLTGDNRAREVSNLFVVDGSSFTTFPEKNPTLTIVALALRAADRMYSLRQRREL